MIVRRAVGLLAFSSSTQPGATPVTPEGKVKAAIDKLLKQHHAYYLKPVQNGMGAAAVDYHGVHQGFGFVIEAKAPGKEPTPRQINTLRAHAAAGGACFFVSGDLTELSNWLTFPFPGYQSQWLKTCLASTGHV